MPHLELSVNIIFNVKTWYLIERLHYCVNNFKALFYFTSFSEFIKFPLRLINGFIISVK